MAGSVIEVNINQTVTGAAAVSGLAANLQSLSKNAIVVQNSISGLKDKLSSTFATCATLSSTLQGLSSSIGQLAQGYNDYDKAMRSVNTMAGKDESGFKDLKTQVSELAKTIPLAKDQLANGLYQVISNGVPEDNWISYLEKSAKASVGGIADLGQTVTVTSTLIKNYGLAWDAAGDIQDKIQLTAKNGVTSFEQLAGALPKVAGSAATLGISVDELMASFATLTGVSGSTDEVATQLVAVMSALTKPTSEATKLAGQMGIQFNAAAIKAAGGMQQFLEQLTSDVKRYAEQTGQLDTEIYSTLFGSSRAIRGLIPITGELADKFKSNVKEMSNSAGTIDGAFDQMNSTSEAATQRIKNQMSALTGLIGQYAATAQPILQYIAVTGQAASGLVTLGTVVSNVVAKLKAMTTAIIGQSASLKLQNFHLNNMIRVERLLTAITGKTTFSINALNIATKALYITISGGIIFVVDTLIQLFSQWLDKTEEVEEKTDVLKNGQDTYQTTVANTSVELETQTRKLGELISAHEDTTEAVEKLNNKYGDIFGTYKDASEWYKVLISNSKAYTEQLGNEAAALEYSTEKARKVVERNQKMRERDRLTQLNMVNLKFKGKDGSITIPEVGSEGSDKDVDTYKQLDKEIKELTKDIFSLEQSYDSAIAEGQKYAAEIKTNIESTSTTIKDTPWQKQTIEQLKKTIEAQRALVDRLGDGTSAEAKEASNLLAKQEARLAMLNKIYHPTQKSKSGKLNGDKLIADADSLEALRNNLKYYDNQLNKTSKDDIEHTKALQAKRDEIDAHIKELELLHEKMGLPKEMKNLSDYDAWLSFLNSAAVTATAEEYVKLKQSIKDVQRQRDEFEAAAEPVLKVEDIKTSEDLEKAISRVGDKLSKATLADRAALIKEKNVLLDLQRTWEDYEESLTAPKDISQLNTVRELSNAVSYYQALQEKQLAEEITNTQKVINKLEAKKTALQRGITLLDKQREIDDMNKLSGKELKIKIRNIGFDELLSKIKELQKALNDTENPVSDDDRVRIEKLIKTYKGWAKQAYNTGDALKDAYSGVKTIGNGIISLNETLKGDGTAWEKIISLVDTFISISEGIGNLVGIVDKLSKLTGIFTAKKVAEGVAEGTAAAAAGENTAAAATNAAAMVATTVANKTATASFVELAAAQYMAAHAYIPFAGFGIASGFAASAAAVVEAIGAMPFAKGGIISGPTLGIMGEYPGASRNPEVVAPLDKLRTLLQPAGGLDAKNFVFKLRGRDLVAVYQGEANIKERM
jgi:TP901 family phage tail tape measure protein